MRYLCTLHNDKFEWLKARHMLTNSFVCQINYTCFDQNPLYIPEICRHLKEGYFEKDIRYTR